MENRDGIYDPTDSSVFKSRQRLHFLKLGFDIVIDQIGGVSKVDQLLPVEWKGCGCTEGTGNGNRCIRYGISIHSGHLQGIIEFYIITNVFFYYIRKNER